MSARTAYLGLSADFHDAAAAVVVDGEILAAAEEERFTRVKHDASLPVNAMAWCLEEAEVDPATTLEVVWYEKPMTAYERLLATQAEVGPRGAPTLVRGVRQWSSRKLWVRWRVERALRALDLRPARVRFAEHHQSHAAAAFYPSPFPSAAILTCDGVGEWATSTMGWGAGHRIEIQRELRFPDSVGLWYSTMAAFCGFAVNDGEGSLMGLAPYGSPTYADVLRERVIHVDDEGAVRLDQRWFDYRAGGRMAHPRLAELLGGPPHPRGTPPGAREADIARSTQVVLEDVMVAMARTLHRLTGERALCLAGGVALNCAANARVLEDGPFDEIWVQPAAGDAGSALGAALWGHHQLDDGARTAPVDRMRGTFLGPRYTTDEVALWLDAEGIVHERIDDEDALADTVAALLAEGRIVGWLRGAMEFGPRALGHRSILADPRDPAMVSRLNQAVKGREGFRPFAPAVLAEECTKWFDLEHSSPYMLLTAPVAEARREEDDGDADGVDADDLPARLGRRRSEISACTHVDQSARVQTVAADVNPERHALLQAFQARTGCPVLVNTSFNRSGEPIVRTPADAYRCFLGTRIDVLVLEGCIVRRDDVVPEEEA